ncbi:UNVERIFIED_ORG: DNA-binding response OmpR family regulator [Pseudomonas psychrophila]
MFFAGCKADVMTSSIFNFAHTEVLIHDIQNLVSTEALHVDVFDSVISQKLNYSEADAFFFEIDTPEAISDSIELIKKIRQTNQRACIFILITHTKPFSSINCYIAGADHCIKIPSNRLVKEKLLSSSLEESHWKKPISLYLDRTRLLLHNNISKLEISYTEMTIIDALIQAPEYVMTQDKIAKTLDPNIVFYDPRALEKTISRLRTKIKKAYNVELILSVRAYGYRLRRATIID